MLTIRSAELSDIPLIAPLFDAYRRFYGAESDPEGAALFLSERTAQGESKIFLALLAGAGGAEVPVGFTQLYPSFSSVSMKRLWILNDLFVSPEHRQAGVASALMREAERFALETGTKGLSLATQIGNRTAQSLYAKLGYRQDSDFLHYNRFF